MSDFRPRVLVSGHSESANQAWVSRLSDTCDVILPQDADPQQAMDAILLAAVGSGMASESALVAQGLLKSIPDSLLVIDQDDGIVWHNDTFRKLAKAEDTLIGNDFWESLDHPELFKPRRFLLHPERDEVSRAVFRMTDRRYISVRSFRSTIPSPNDQHQRLTALTIRDVTNEVFEATKKEALYRAGQQLQDLSPEEIAEMADDQRMELLKDKIIELSREILGFDTIEIRVLSPETNELMPLIEEGMKTEAAERQLFAETTGNGVTGYVAATGEPRLCPDTQNDPLYLSGAVDARSSLTVPLVVHEEVLGTFNVESPGLRRFDEKDLEFLELFGSVVALAINQLQLLAIEQEISVTESSGRLRRDVALPTDEILSDATALLDRYIGHDPDLCDRLRKILENTRTIRSQIERVSEESCPTEFAIPGHAPRRTKERPALKGKRILVVDGDASVLASAHDLLDPYQCEVETVRSGQEACQMARSHHYDAVLTDIRLADMNGYECFCSIKEIDERLPVILMTGFGYDAGHSIVKSRQRGCKAVLYKPFRREQLLTEVENAVTPPPPLE